jgi:hypothetical protein
LMDLVDRTMFASNLEAVLGSGSDVGCVFWWNKSSRSLKCRLNRFGAHYPKEIQNEAIDVFQISNLKDINKICDAKTDFYPFEVCGDGSISLVVFSCFNRRTYLKLIYLRAVIRIDLWKHHSR